MRTRQIRLIFGLLSCFAPGVLRAELDVPSDGSDGAFTPSANIQVDLGEAVSGTWGSNNNANSGKGVYDPSKWAVVFKYSSVNIPAGVTVTFKNHPSRAPVVWLVTGDVTVEGTVRLDSTPGSSTAHSEPGPGGFRGGLGRDDGASDALGSGFGPGGAGVGGAGGYMTAASGNIYGNTRIVPLIGGSGAGGSTYVAGSRPSAGTGGGGALMIACRNRVTLNGLISCRSADNTQLSAQTGSGGAAKIIADSIVGSGQVDVRAGTGGGGSSGRIRLEATNYTASILYQPSSIVVTPDSPVQLWPSGSSPTCRVVSVNGLETPEEPLAMLSAPSADVIFTAGGSVPVVVETTNLPTTSVVSVRVVPTRGNSITVSATLTSGDQSSATWTAMATVPTGHSAIQVRALAP